LDGAIAALYLDGRLLDVLPLPVLRHKSGRRELDPVLLAGQIRWLQSRIPLAPPPRLAVVEAVGARPGQGVVSMFGFGRTLGAIEGVLAAMSIPVERPTPQRWKKAILDGTKKDKTAAIAYVRRRFPGAELVPKGKRTPHDGMAESLCLAEYGRRLLAGESDGAA
jgi:hypothetical protein